VKLPSTACRRTRSDRSSRGAGRRCRLATVAVFSVLIGGGLAGIREASAQLCSWGGTPSLPAPEVEHLSSQAGSVRAPGRVAVDLQNNLYITDPTTGHVVVKDPHGARKKHAVAKEPGSRITSPCV